MIQDMDKHMNLYTLKMKVPLLFPDLVPKENVEAWLKYLRNEFPAVAFKASTQAQNENLVMLPFL